MRASAASVDEKANILPPQLSGPETRKVYCCLLRTGYNRQVLTDPIIHSACHAGDRREARF